MIVLDVPGIVQPKKDKTLIFIILYQVYLAVAFLIGGKIGAYMTKKMCTWFRHSPPYFEDITGARNYPYYYSWKNLLLSTVKLAKPNLKRYRPSVPTVYLYAAKKPFQFHG